MPVTTRRRDDWSVSATWSEMAAIGGDSDGSAGRADRRHHRDADADDERGDDGAGLEHEPVGREGDAEALQQCLQADRSQDAQSQADERGHETHDGRFGQHRAEDLAPAGSQDPQAGRAPWSAGRR